MGLNTSTGSGFDFCETGSDKSFKLPEPNPLGDLYNITYKLLCKTHAKKIQNKLLSNRPSIQGVKSENYLLEGRVR